MISGSSRNRLSTGRSSANAVTPSSSSVSNAILETLRGEDDPTAGPAGADEVVRLLRPFERHRVDRVLEPLSSGERDQLGELVPGAPDAGEEVGLVRYGAEAERDASAEESDHDRDPLPVDEPTGLGERRAPPHADEDRPGRP